MAKLKGLTEKLNKAQSIDFAEMFGKKMTTLQQVLGISTPITSDSRLCYLRLFILGKGKLS